MHWSVAWVKADSRVDIFQYFIGSGWACLGILDTSNAYQGAYQCADGQCNEQCQRAGSESSGYQVGQTEPPWQMSQEAAGECHVQCCHLLCPVAHTANYAMQLEGLSKPCSNVPNHLFVSRAVSQGDNSIWCDVCVRHMFKSWLCSLRLALPAR